MKELFLLLINCGVVLSINPCCPNGEIMERTSCGNFIKPQLFCPEGMMILKDIILNGNKVSRVDTPGYIFVEDPNQYCVGQMYRNHRNKKLGLTDVAIVCYVQDRYQEPSHFETSGILTLISVVFLLATIVVYTYLPQMRDLQGLCYLSTCISMSQGFLWLGILQLNPAFSIKLCTVIGYLVYTWMLATFFWMNIISINTFQTVLDAAYLQKIERKQYLIYSTYGWGCPAAFLIIALITNFVEGNHYKPGFGDGTCWFVGRTETWLFFYGPVAILIASNVVLFVLSSYHLWQKTKKYKANTLNNLKHSFGLSLKLILVMGISWIFEIASFAHGEQHIIWKIMDTFNCLQGVIIFLLLVVFRRRAMRGLASEHCCLPITRPLAEKLSPHDDPDDQHILADETVEVRLN